MIALATALMCVLEWPFWFCVTSGDERSGVTQTSLMTDSPAGKGRPGHLAYTGAPSHLTKYSSGPDGQVYAWDRAAPFMDHAQGRRGGGQLRPVTRVFQVRYGQHIAGTSQSLVHSPPTINPPASATIKNRMRTRAVYQIGPWVSFSDRM